MRSISDIRGNLAPQVRPAPPTRSASPRGRRPRRWIALAVVVALVVPTADSYVHALRAPGNESMGIRSTEWLRSHHFRWLVNDVENFWYTHHQPKKGGAPTGGLAGDLRGAATRPAKVAVRPSAASAVLPAPAPLKPFVATPLLGEGQWTVKSTVHGFPAIEAAYLRPDAVHTSLVSVVAWIDPKLVRIAGYAGVEQPGGTWPLQAPIPAAVRPSLIAAFNSGFKMEDAKGGFYSSGRYARPLVAGQATAWIDTSGRLQVGQWGRDVTMGPNVVFARQNLALIVDHGQPVPDVGSSDTAKWGVTVGNKVLVWRSGVGVTADGAIVYAAGDGLSALTLAQLLSRAGAVRGMELDINSAWTCFFTYSPAPQGVDAAQLTVTKLLADMAPSTSNYLTASNRDFFAVFQR